MGGQKKYPPPMIQLSRTVKLNYRWHEMISNLETKVQPYPARRIREVVAFADYFVGKWGDWAERSKMQPVHLLRNSPDDQSGRGLAWRWLPEMDMLGFPQPGYLLSEYEGVTGSGYILYRFDPDGRCVMVTGSERVEIIGVHPALMEQPSNIERALSGGD